MFGVGSAGRPRRTRREAGRAWCGSWRRRERVLRTSEGEARRARISWEVAVAAASESTYREGCRAILLVHLPMASSSKCRSGLTSSRWRGSAQSVGSGSAGQCKSFSRFLGRSSSSLRSSAGNPSGQRTGARQRKRKASSPTRGRTGAGGGSYLAVVKHPLPLCFLKQATEQLCGCSGHKTASSVSRRRCRGGRVWTD